MTFGPPGSAGARITDLATVEKVLDTFKHYGYDELDTARGYCDGKEEGFVTEAGWKERGFKMGTKCYPIKAGGHSAESLREALETSLRELKTKKLDIFYLHAPDYTTPLADTVQALDVLYKEGKFDVYGISNFAVIYRRGFCNGSPGKWLRCAPLRVRGTSFNQRFIKVGMSDI